jgi:hypothetical protein
VSEPFVGGVQGNRDAMVANDRRDALAWALRLLRCIDNFRRRGGSPNGADTLFR